jgi:phage shock protein PspC (stress-responsive transcriptional regulator)
MRPGGIWLQPKNYQNMKKIININLSGRVIPIEDSAYEKLKSYIESLRKYFVKEEDRDEIINDIESRIAELMNEKIRKGAACITDADIDEIAASMGRPEDFEAEASDKAQSAYQNSSSQQQSTSSDKKARRRLYRDENDKFIAGVCSGIAAYLNVDPAIVRILFAIITFGGFGLGFFAYIVLWIFVPAKDVEGFMGKRLYRNPDDRVIGGVAGGLAAYFNRETWVIRLLFAAPFLLSLLLNIVNGITWHTGFGDFFPNILFGSIGSTFLITYIILWVVLPEARSTYEKMEMRGEKVDVNTIRQNMKERIKEWSEEVKESAENIGKKAKEFANTKGKTFASEAGDTVRRGGRGLGHAIGVLFKVFFLVIAGTFAFGLFVALMALLFGGMAWWPINNFLWTSKWQQLFAWGTLIFFLIVPLIGFITWLVRRIIGVRRRTSYLGWIFGVLWTIGWVCAILLATSAFNDWSEFQSGQERTITTAQPPNGKMIVVVSQPEIEYTGRFGWMNDDREGWDLTNDSLKVAFVRVDVQKSMDSLYHVHVNKYSFGKNREDARRRADQFEYTVSSIDSVLDLANGFSIYKDSKFRGQRVQVLIEVPVGKKIMFDESVRYKLNSLDVDYKGYRGRRRNVEVIIDGHVEYWWNPGVEYTMQPNGQLNNPSGKTPYQHFDGYRYEDTPREENDAERIKREDLQERERILREKERTLEEEKRRLDDERKKQSQRVTTHMETVDDEEDQSLSGSPSPVFSMVRIFF